MADKKVDPRLYIPLVEGYSYDEPLQGDVGAGEPAQDDYSDLDISAGIQPPSSVMIVDQIFRKSPDGSTVVDLVLEVEDVPGAQEYEVRVANR